jgi:hypothetical protein
MQIPGRTDRASHLETITTQIRGTGAAKVTVTYQPPGTTVTILFSAVTQLPMVVPTNVSTSTQFENVTVTVQQLGRQVIR